MMDTRKKQEEIEQVLYRSVRLALNRDGKDWYTATARRARVLAHRLFIDLFDGDVMPLKYKRALVDDIEEALRETDRSNEDLAKQAHKIAKMLAHHVIDSVVTAGAPDGWYKRWVTMADDRVRASHRAVHGETVRTGEEFTVAGVGMRGPGDVLAPVDQIVNCRCYLIYGPADSIDTWDADTPTANEKRSSGRTSTSAETTTAGSGSRRSATATASSAGTHRRTGPSDSGAPTRSASTSTPGSGPTTSSTAATTPAASTPDTSSTATMPTTCRTTSEPDTTTPSRPTAHRATPTPSTDASPREATARPSVSARSATLQTPTVDVGRSDGPDREALTAAVGPPSIIIAAIPADDDGVWGVSSESPPHMTMLYMHADATEDAKAAIHATQGVVTQMDVTHVGELGDEGARVAFLDPPETFHALREALMEQPGIREAMGRMTQYPQWTPHLTLGYPETPQTGDAPERITFDRLAVIDDGVLDEAPLDDLALAASGGDMELLDVYEVVPWYGVLAPEDASTGDRRKFDADSLTWRDLPLPLRWQKYDDEGHKGSVVVGNIETIERDDKGLLWATGTFSQSDEANEVIGLVAERALRGVSVDLDDVEVETRLRSTGEKAPDTFETMEEALEAARDSEDVVTKGRVCSGAMCAIPAFAEAFVSLGHRPVEDWMSESLIAAAYATVDEKPWSEYPEKDYTVEQWHNACLVHLHSTKATAKSECKLPIRTPSGTINRAGVHAAASRIGQVDAPPAAIASARRALVRAYEEIGEEPPESLVASADLTNEYTEFTKHDLIFVEGRRTPKVVSRGQKYEPSEAEGKIVKRRHATEEEERTIRRGDWVRVNVDGKKPGQPGYMERRSRVRPQNNGADVVTFAPTDEEADGIAEGMELFTQYADLAPGRTEDGPGWLTHPVDTDRLRDYWVRGAGAAKIGWGLPGDFNRCRANLAKYIKPQYLSGYCANRHYDALGFWPGQHRGRAASRNTLVAAGVPIAPAWNLVAAAEPGFRPPRGWFDDPSLPGITPTTITDEGRVYGHLAEWGACHTGNPDSCTEAPHSLTDYAYFHLGAVRTDEGDIPCGSITVDTGHAALNWNGAQALAHYDNTGTVVAHVRVGEDAHGIWFAGAIASYATEQQIDKLRACKISGDWRWYGGNLEMIAALGVNAPGFPIVRPALAASAGHPTALVAAGLITVDNLPATETIGDIVSRAIAEYREYDAIKASVIKRRRETLAAMRER